LVQRRQELKMEDSRRRIGVLTSGGDCPGLNAVIRGVVKTATYLGYEVFGFLNGYEGLDDPVRYVPLDFQNTTGILVRGGTILGSTNKGRFGATCKESDRLQIDPNLLSQVKTNLEELSIDGLVCIGGDGSLAIAQQFHEFGIPVVGVPKTIDNDLQCTAYSFGFDSAVDCATDALDRLHTTAASHNRVMVLEVMGRHAGWIALYAGIAGGGDVILIPEIDWTFENICAKISQRRNMGKQFTLVVVAEGAKLPGGHLVTLEASHGNQQARLGGLGDIVAAEIKARMQVESRCVVLGHLQRGGGPTAFDRVLATQFGAHAVRLIEEGKFGEMVYSDPPHIRSIPIEQAIVRLSTVDPNGSAVVAAKALGISFGDIPGYINPFVNSQIKTAAAAEQYNVGAEFVRNSEMPHQ
jgi:ATP-dependent phosphofructokinase / diphosphate-dependent phosphofructokinase